MNGEPSEGVKGIQETGTGFVVNPSYISFGFASV